MDGTADAEFQDLVGRMAKDEGLLTEAAAILKDSAVSLGILLRHPHPQHQETLKVAPLTLFPNLIPRQALQEIIQLQCDINLLMHRVGHDREFLNLALGGAASVDPFIQNLFDIYQKIPENSQWELGLIRSDYILSHGDCPKSTHYQQVEINMVCVGLAGLGSKVGFAHDRVLRFLGSSLLRENSGGSGADTLSLYGDGLRLAYDLYCKNVNTGRKKAPLMLIVIHDAFEFNIMDQRAVEFATNGLVCIRRSFRQIAKTAYLDEEMCLFVEDREVALVYYRTGYSPDQYEDRDWELRLLMEKSNAIKSPSVAHQLSGFKKIQQMLSRPEILQRFIPEKDLITRLRKTFVGQWDVSEAGSNGKIEEALREPEKFVLKPNREGGGNNFYGQDLVDKLKQVRGTTRAQEYILMDLIRPVLQKNYLVRPDLAPELMETISEVGVFGVILAKNGEFILNKNAQQVLVRSKANGVREGGVSSGHACISSALVVDP